MAHMLEEVFEAPTVVERLPSHGDARLDETAATIRARWARRHGAIGRWRLANLVTGGRLLAANTGSPLARDRARTPMASTRIQEVPDGP